MEQEKLYSEIDREQDRALGWEAKRLFREANPSDRFLSFFKERSSSRKSQPLSGDFNDTVKNASSKNMKSRRYRNELFDILVECWCSSMPLNLRSLINDVERSVIIKVLGRVNGNQRIAAKVLGLSPTTLNEKLKKFGISLRKSPIIDK